MSFQAVKQRGAEFLKPYEANSLLKRVGRKAAFVATGLFAKSMIMGAFNTEVHNLINFKEAYRQSKMENRGLITIMNHTSVVDEPLSWGVLPYDHLLYPQRMRWTLGAENVCFKNKYLGAFFSAGQVLSTKRFGAGIFQGSIDAAIHLASPEAAAYSTTIDKYGATARRTPSANWVHIFPEALVHQPVAPYNNTLRYFHWGVSRIVLEASRPPIILPIFTKGLENAMPEDKPSFFPRTSGAVQYSFGQQMDEQVITNFREEWLALANEHNQNGDMPEILRTGPEAENLRSRVAASIRSAVLLASQQLEGVPNDDPRFSEPSFWHLPEQERGLHVKTNPTGRISEPPVKQ